MTAEDAAKKTSRKTSKAAAPHPAQRSARRAVPATTATLSGVSLPVDLPAGTSREALRQAMSAIVPLLIGSPGIAEFLARAREATSDRADLSFRLDLDDTTLQLEADQSKPDLWVLQGSPNAGELRPVAAAEVTAADMTTEAMLNRLVADSVLAGWLEVLAQRLQTSPAELLIGLDQLADALPAGAHEPTAGLTEHEEEVLRAAGSLQQPMPAPGERASLRTAVKDAAIRSSALTVRQAAKQLGVTDGRIRQRLTARTLHGMLVDGAWQLPRWQFGEDGKPIRGLEKVLPRLPEGMHPVAVHAWLTTPKSDLELDGDPISPVQWLAGGGKVDEVTALVGDLDWPA